MHLLLLIIKFRQMNEGLNIFMWGFAYVSYWFVSFSRNERICRWFHLKINSILSISYYIFTLKFSIIYVRKWDWNWTKKEMSSFIGWHLIQGYCDVSCCAFCSINVKTMNAPKWQTRLKCEEILKHGLIFLRKLITSK